VTWFPDAFGLDKVIHMESVENDQPHAAWVFTEIVPDPPFAGTVIEPGVIE
jgi:hypothetical protein